MNTRQLIDYCRKQGISFFLENSTIRVHGTASAIEKVLPVLQANKKEIFQFLSTETSNYFNDITSNDVFHSEMESQKALNETRSLLNRIMSRHV